MSREPDDQNEQLDLWPLPPPAKPSPVPKEKNDDAAPEEAADAITPPATPETAEKTQRAEGGQSYTALDFAREQAGLGDCSGAREDWPSTNELGADEEPPPEQTAEEPVPGTDDSSTAAFEDWKAELREDFERWLDSLEDIPEAGDTEADLEESPDLYSFYEQLAAANVETRKANRRTAEAFSQWAETLGKFDADLRLLREQLARQPVKEDSLPRVWAIALVEIVDRLRRLATAFVSPPPRKWLANDAHWRKAWAIQQQGFDILVSHVETLLKQAGITRVHTLHQPFNPATMAAVATDSSASFPAQTVIEEVAPGYRLHEQLLRVAQVKVSAGNDSTP